MALPKTLWTAIVDLVSTGQNVSDNLDVAFSNIDDAIDVIDDNVLRIAALEGIHVGSAISVASDGLPKQTLVADTAEVLEWMETTLVDVGTDIEHTIATNSILIKTAGIYKVFGNVALTAPINDIVDIELYVDNLPTGFIASGIGRGDGSIISFQNSFLASFDINDDIHLYVKSSGTEVTLSSSTMSIEKTEY